MDSLLDQARTLYEGEIDFTGQHLAETLSTVLLTLSGILAFLAGFLTQNIYHTLYIGLGGTALTFLVVVPPWPFFNQKGLRWLPARTGRGAWMQQGIEIVSSGGGGGGGEAEKKGS